MHILQFKYTGFCDQMSI